MINHMSCFFFLIILGSSFSMPASWFWSMQEQQASQDKHSLVKQWSNGNPMCETRWVWSKHGTHGQSMCPPVIRRGNEQFPVHLPSFPFQWWMFNYCNVSLQEVASENESQRNHGLLNLVLICWKWYETSRNNEVCQKRNVFFSWNSQDPCELAAEKSKSRSMSIMNAIETYVVQVQTCIYIHTLHMNMEYHILYIYIYILVGGLQYLLFLHILGMSSSQLTNSIIFQRGRLNHQPESVPFSFIHMLVYQMLL